MWRPARSAPSLIASVSLTLTALAALAADPGEGFLAGRPVVELFTSQGCSSCPPADRLMARLPAADAVVLAFHVDYWNSLGWTDPFSTPQASQRQRQYATVFGAHRVYTPQAVVNGRTEGEGSDARWLRQALAAAADEPAGRFRGHARLTADAHVRAVVEATRPDGVAGALDLLVALTESGLSTRIPRGENAHKELRNDHVVRRMAFAGRLEPGAAFVGPVAADFDLAPGWATEGLRVVAFLQDHGSTRIRGGVELRPEN